MRSGESGLHSMWAQNKRYGKLHLKPLLELVTGTGPAPSVNRRALSGFYAFTMVS